ncbi:hypothetical protein HDU92_004547 [Lobulomyces angularis]|nr:hypothetical protein HDU92_004547 [Lobulomyces angularis]
MNASFSLIKSHNIQRHHHKQQKILTLVRIDSGVWFSTCSIKRQPNQYTYTETLQVYLLREIKAPERILTKMELIERIFQFWEEIDENLLNSLSDSIGLKEVIRLGGKPTNNQ